ncbi:MAG: YraN family protein [Alphaproteobacteria bacterium]|nr:YraN family protein [Alphaproteobacteria bacterium]MBQ8660391.1 YraN family protein [Alphaproteobacteria bacterium]MBR4315630.1 YraN family protein [Alphaproteobacteria bacterium]
MQLLNLKNSYYSGKFSEFIAKVFLILKGYRIISSRYSAIRGSQAGEIDIIAKHHRTIVFIEVKKRTSIDLAKEVIFSRQQKRIYHSAEIFLAKNKKYQNFDCRFDAICFDKYFRFTHIKNAWGL